MRLISKSAICGATGIFGSWWSDRPQRYIEYSGVTEVQGESLALQRGEDVNSDRYIIERSTRINFLRQTECS